MKIKTSELTGAALDWAVAMSQGYRFGQAKKVLDQIHFPLSRPDWKTLGNAALHKDGTWCKNVPAFSSEWSAGGALIETFGVSIFLQAGGEWGAEYDVQLREDYYRELQATGKTPLEAAMRVLACETFGDEVEVPDELVNNL